MEANTHLDIFENGLNEQSKAYLLETTRWTKFLAIVGFIGLGFLVIAALVIMTMGSYFSGAIPGLSSIGGVLGSIGIGLIYLIIAAFYFYPMYSLFKFSTKMKLGIRTNNQETITEAFRHQKNMYKFMGILMIIVLCFYLLIFIVAGLGAAFMSR